MYILPRNPYFSQILNRGSVSLYTEEKFFFRNILEGGYVNVIITPCAFIGCRLSAAKCSLFCSKLIKSKTNREAGLLFNTKGREGQYVPSSRSITEYECCIGATSSTKNTSIASLLLGDT